MASTLDTLGSFTIDGIDANDVTADGVVLVAPFVRALLQCQKMHRWATPSVIPDMVLPKALDGEFSISVESFGSHLDNTGLLGDVAKRGTRILGGDDGYFSTSGTTASNHKVMLTIASVFPGTPVTACRNVHHSITHSSNMYNVPLVFAKSDGYIEDLEAILPPSPSDIEAALQKHPESKVVLVTSPTYEGVIADVAGIAEVVHAHGALLWVDQAWGSHLGLSDRMPRSSIQLGADIMSTSTHKTGGALQGAAMLIFKRNSPLITPEFEQALREAHQEVETTSPNFEIIASIDAALCRIASEPAILDRVADRIVETKECLRKTFGDRVAILENSHPQLASRGLVLDPVRVQIGLPTGAVGHVVASYLEHHGIIAEKAGLRTCLFIATFQLPPDAPQRLARVLARALKQAAVESPRAALAGPHEFPSVAAPQWLIDASTRSPEPTFAYNPRIVSAAAAVGMVAHETVECYPPGIPVIIPGYLITEDQIAYLTSMKAAGAHIVAADKSLDTFRVRERARDTST